MDSNIKTIVSMLFLTDLALAFDILLSIPLLNRLDKHVLLKNLVSVSVYSKIVDCKRDKTFYFDFPVFFTILSKTP